MPEDMKIYTPEEAADILRIKTRTMMEWLRKGKVPGRKIGGCWRILASDLEAFVSNIPSNQEQQK